MKQDTPSSELRRLTIEIERYLAAVEAFRAAGSEPTWAPEQPPPEWWTSEHLVAGVGPAPLAV
jgi:hypothetical protein